jgi:hypothetical protein
MGIFDKFIGKKKPLPPINKTKYDLLSDEYETYKFIDKESGNKRKEKNKFEKDTEIYYAEQNKKLDK